MARGETQLLNASLSHHPHVLWTYDQALGHLVTRGTIGKDQVDRVAWLKLVETKKRSSKCTAMPRNHDSSALSREGSLRPMPRSVLQILRLDSFTHPYLQGDSGYPNETHSDRRISVELSFQGDGAGRG